MQQNGFDSTISTISTQQPKRNCLKYWPMSDWFIQLSSAVQWIRLKTSPCRHFQNRHRMVSHGGSTSHHKFQYSNCPILDDLEVQENLGNLHILHMLLLLELWVHRLKHFMCRFRQMHPLQTSTVQQSLCPHFPHWININQIGTSKIENHNTTATTYVSRNFLKRRSAKSQRGAFSAHNQPQFLKCQSGSPRRKALRSGTGPCLSAFPTWSLSRDATPWDMAVDPWSNSPRFKTCPLISVRITRRSRRWSLNASTSKARWKVKAWRPTCQFIDSTLDVAISTHCHVTEASRGDPRTSVVVSS